jgi:hypothetical protein
MMSVNMANEIEGLLQLGRSNADTMGLTELLSLLPVVGIIKQVFPRQHGALVVWA